MADTNIKHSLDLIRRVVAASADDLARNFRAGALTSDQRALVLGLIPSDSMPVRQFLHHAAATIHTLAVSGLDRETALEALGEYMRLLAPLTANDADAERARVNLHNALRLLLRQQWADLLRAEVALLNQLLEAEAFAEDESLLAAGVLKSLVGHFRAESGAWLRETDGELVVIAGENLPSAAETSPPRRAKKPAKGPKSLSPSHPAQADSILLRTWREQGGSVWSIPAEPATVQLRFAAERSMSAQETRMLELAGKRLSRAVSRIDREIRSREMSVRMLQVEELERRRIARELHDDAGQSLVVVRLQLEMLELSLTPEAEDARKSLSEIRQITEKTIFGVRRLISDLSPAVLEQLGLGAAVRQLANRLRADYPVRVKIQVDSLPRLDPHVELAIYRVLQECFTNVVRHSRAGKVNVSLTAADRTLRLLVEDDGVGFQVEEGLGRRNCFGLLGIRERVNLLGGEFAIRSYPRARERDNAERWSGTRIGVQIPLSAGVS